MHFKALPLLLFLVGTTTAQTATVSPASSTSGSTSATATSLPGLVNQLPRCALSCLESGAQTIGCSVSDLTCLCSSTERLIASVGGCILTSSCSSDEISQASEIAPQICSDVNNNPDPSEIASASNLIDDAVSTAGGSASSTTSGNAAARTDVAMGVMGAAAAFAALAL